MTWMRHPTSVYFIKPVGEAGPIKIGCSAWIKGRVLQLKTNTKLDLELITSALGDHATERDVHRKFAEYRTADPAQQGSGLAYGGATEWFEPSVALLSFIQDVIATRSIPLGAHERWETMIADRRATGESMQAIGRDFGISRQRVHQILQSISWKQRMRAPSPADRVQAA